MSTDQTSTGADLVVRRLRDHGVDVVFGYPGGQLTPLYDALAREGTIRHVLARDEQAAGFMADGYARASGRPGVCLAVCGPGVLNAATPLATAYTDSTPILVLSGQVPSKAQGLRSGYYHENEQLHAVQTLTKWAGRPEDVTQIVSTLDHAFEAMTTGRPGPTLVEIPVDVLRQSTTCPDTPPLPSQPAPRSPREADLQALVQTVRTWQRPLLLVGGGVISAGAEGPVAELAERLGAPVFHTAMGKTVLSATHPLHAGMPWRQATSDLSDMGKSFSPLFEQADGLLALGCRFTQLATGSWTLKLPPLVHLDIDGEELGRHYQPLLKIQADARLTLQALLAQFPSERRSPWTDPRPTGERWQLPGIDLVPALRRALPTDAILVADITRLAYILLVEWPSSQPRTFLHPAGYVSMGFGIPAALGARLAFPQRPIVAIVGDGCFLMSGMELASAVQEQLPIVIILLNDGSLTLIKAIQQRRYAERYLGVDLRNPDFGLFAQAFGVRHQAVDDVAGFEAALQHALTLDAPTLLEVRLPGLT